MAQSAADWRQVVLAALLIPDMHAGHVRAAFDYCPQSFATRACKGHRVNRRPPAREPVHQNRDRRIASRHQDRRVNFIGQLKRGDVRATAPRPLQHPGRGREREMRRRLRHGHDFSAHACERDPRLRAGRAASLVREPTGVDKRRFLIVDFAEQRFSRLRRVRAQAESRLPRPDDRRPTRSRPTPAARFPCAAPARSG